MNKIQRLVNKKTLTTPQKVHTECNLYLRALNATNLKLPYYYRAEVIILGDAVS